MRSSLAYAYTHSKTRWHVADAMFRFFSSSYRYKTTVQLYAVEVSQLTGSVSGRAGGPKAKPFALTNGRFSP